MDNNSVASTSRGDPRAEPELATKKPRPKPRKKVLTGLIDTAPSAPPSDLAPITTPVPKSVSAVALPETTIPTKPQPQGIPLTIADRAKSRLRNARAKPAAQDIIDIPSDDDDDERLLKLSPHRPMQQDVRRINTNPVPNQLPPPFHPSQESLVAPTSDFQLAPVVSSQLPPSDPPSTLPLVASTPDSAKKRKEVTEAGNVDESLLNSPKRRKGQHLVTDNKKDQRHISPPRAIAAGDPPPNFFASSSSSLPQPPAPLIQRKTRKKPAEKIQPPDNAPEAVDPDPPRKKGRPNPKKKSTPKTTSVSFASTSRPKPDSKDPVYKSMEVIEDSDQEAEFPTLPPPPLLKSHSPLSGLSESNSFRTSKPITPNRRRLLPEVVITTVPRKRSSPAEERRVIDKDGSPKGKKRQKKATDDHFDGLDDEVSKKGSKGKGKAPAKRKRGTKPQPKEATGDRVLEEDPVDNPVGTSKTKSARSRKSRIVDSDDEVEEGAAGKDSEVTYKTPQEVMDKTPSQDTRVGLALICPPETVYQFVIYRKTRRTP